MESFSLAGGKLFVSYLENVSSREKIYSPDGKHLGDVPFPGIGTGGVSGRWDKTEAFLNFSSFVTPTTIHRYDTATAAQELWFRANVPLDSSKFEVKQVRYRSKDGTEIPMFLVHAKGLNRDGNNPTFLTGYGGFNISRTPTFSATVAAWAESGGVYALPSLRGGGEFGEDWHRAGMMEKKQNVFDDFIAAAEWLIANDYTKPDRLAIVGGSNGGLLVGAALTQRPELFRAVVCTVPLLDMLRYHKFLVARFWVPEYGAAENPDHFLFLHGYSPYHRVKPGTRYPAVMFMTGDSDTRVDPLHARKMAALLQASTASGPDRPILLHYDTKSGHAGVKPLRKTIQDLTDELAFLFWQLGMKVPTATP
jgi:prolyl oligopeptidase